MKWIALVCLVICAAVSESRHLNKRDAEHHPRHIGAIAKIAGERDFKQLLLVMVAQNLQRCSLEEHYKLQEELNNLAKHCVAHEEEEDCKKPLITLFHDKICKIPDIGHSYPWIPECCAKHDPERVTCFKEHRDVKEEPYQKPDIEKECKEHKENPQHAFDHYTDAISKKHPSLYPPVVLSLAVQYNTAVTECCEAEDKPKCFEDRLVELTKKTHYMESVQEHKCRILKNFPERTYQAYKLASITQKYPAASFEEIQKLTLESVHLTKDCCKDDVVECMVEKMEVTQHICDHQEKISSHLKDCCEKPLLERSSCIHALPNDEPPADLPKDMKEFVEDEHVCKHFEEEKDIFLAKFTYEFIRTHNHLAPQSYLRVASGYENLLKKCCATENPHECYKIAPQLLETAIQESIKLEKENCAALQTLGPYFFSIELITRYTRKMPQVSAETLIGMTSQMTKIGGKCCALPEDQRIPCAEKKLDFLIGDLCEKQSHIFINDNVRHCCADSYAQRRPCFTNLGVDPSYKPAELDENNFHFDADFCDATEEKQQHNKKKLLINLLKLKPDLSKEKLDELIKEFGGVTKKCCEAADHSACFAIEKPALFLHVKEAVAH